jgi:hypothetical protein
MTTDVLYHYTTGNIFRLILKQKAIIPNKTEPDNPTEIPTVTFSTNPVWERTRYRVGKMPDGQLVLMNQKLLKEFDNGLIRIVVPKSVAPLDWKATKDQCGMSREAIQGIYNFAIEVGARTNEWFVTTEPVPEDVWITVEKMNDQDEWVELPDDEIPEPVEELAPVVEISAETKN